jgi:hypothetical protein
MLASPRLERHKVRARIVAGGGTIRAARWFVRLYCVTELGCSSASVGRIVPIGGFTVVDDDVQYEHQSVKVIRGREAKKIAEMENQRWELMSQTQGTLRTELTFRRIQKRAFAPWMGAVALLGIGVLLFALSALGGDEKTELTDPPPAAASSAAEEPTESSSEESSESTAPTEDPTEDPTEEPTEDLTEEPTEEPTKSEAPAAPVNGVLTTDNTADLKALLEADDNYRLNQAFAKTHKGRQIAFNGSVADATPGYYLVYFGDNSDTNATSGPAFQFRVQTLQAGGAPVATGDNLRFIAQVSAFNVDQGLFFLTPVKVTAR